MLRREGHETNGNNEGKQMTEIGHFIDNARVAGTSTRQPVFNPATGYAMEKTVALATRAEVAAPSPPQRRGLAGMGKDATSPTSLHIDLSSRPSWQRADQLAEVIWLSTVRPTTMPRAR